MNPWASGLLAGVVVLLGTGPATQAQAEADLRAEQIRPDTVSQLQIGGPDAIGGVGDWALVNDVIEVIVDDVSREHAKLNHGGTIVDLGLRDRRDEDQFARLFPLVNLTQRVWPGYDAVRAEVDPGGAFARIVVTSSGLRSLPREGLAGWLDPRVPDPVDVENVRVETVYQVKPGEPHVSIATTLTNRGDDAAPVFSFGDVWMRGGRSARAFLGHDRDLSQARGFHHRSFDRNLLFSSGALASFTWVSLLGSHGFPPIGYTLYAPSRTRRDWPLFGVSGEHVSVALAFVGDPEWRELTALRLARAVFLNLEPGESWVYERRILVTGRADVASATDVLFRPYAKGREPSGIQAELDDGRRGAILVESASGQPITEIGPEDGRFSALLPGGNYRLTLRAEHTPTHVLTVPVPGGQVTRVAFPKPSIGRLRFDPAFADGGPGRIVIRGRDGTADPVFGAELLDFRLDGEPQPSGTETSSLYFLGNPHDPREIALPTGRYTLVATRGLEHTAATFDVEIAEPGDRVAVAPIALERLDPLPGFVTADLHVHAEASDDSATPNLERLRHFVADGLDVLVATDHDHVADYGPALEELEVGDRIRVVRGVEVTSSTPSPGSPWTIGHHNAWPVPYEPHAHRQGAPESQNRTAAELYSELRRDYGVELVQLNHPRGKQPGMWDGSFFTHLGLGHAFDPALPLDAASNRLLLDTRAADGTRALDFDLIEVMNGDSYPQYLATRTDWYALLRQGERRTATANSDTHGPDEIAGYPRNYVRVGERGGVADVDRSLREGRAFGTTGPLVRRFEVNGATLGDTVAAPEGSIRIDYEVAAAPWVPLDEVRIVVNGEVERFLGDPKGAVELALSADAFVTLEAGVSLDTDPATWATQNPGPYSVLAPGFVPTAFTNPVFVDVDGNGRFDPPGLPPAPLRVDGWIIALGVGALLSGWVALRFRRRG